MNTGHSGSTGDNALTDFQFPPSSQVSQPADYSLYTYTHTHKNYDTLLAKLS